jgi:hypothetical protein
MNEKVQLAIIALIVILVAAWIFFNYNCEKKGSNTDPKKEEIAANLDKMKRLWVERSYLTRMSNIESLTGYNGASITQQRVLNSAQQIGRNLGYLYTTEEGDTFSNLLTEQHQIMLDILKLTREHKDVTYLYERLKKNSEVIADFLVSVCPNLNKERIMTLFSSQIDNFLKTVLFTIKSENTASMAAFDSCNKCTQELATYLNDSIWKHLTHECPRYF